MLTHRKPVEYEFTLPDGTKRYEFIDPEIEMPVIHQINLCMGLHGAVAAQPVEPTLFDFNNDSPA